MQQELSFYRTTKGYKNNHKTTELTCENCQAPFLANRKNARFCSSSCRSQFWLDKNDKRVITLAVPADIDDTYLDHIKEMLINYKSKKAKGDSKEESQPKFINEDQFFESVTDLTKYLHAMGYEDFKIPRMDMGIYYDEGLTIKKTEGGFETRIHMRR